MEAILNYVKPELLVVSVVLYLLGKGFKKADLVADKYIPLLLGGFGVLLSFVYVFSSCPCTSPSQVLFASFTAFTQGILVAGLSTYVHQIRIQMKKEP